MTKSLEALIATTKADIAKRKTMPEFGESVDGNIQRLNTINETKASFSLENVEALIAALEQAQKQKKSWKTLAKKSISERSVDIELLLSARQRIAELEDRPLCVNPDAMREVAPLCVKLPTEFISEHGVVVQLEKVMAALAVNGVKYERRNQQVVGLRAGIESMRAAGIGVDVDKIAAEKCHK